MLGPECRHDCLSKSLLKNLFDINIDIHLNRRSYYGRRVCSPDEYNMQIPGSHLRRLLSRRQQHMRHDASSIDYPDLCSNYSQLNMFIGSAFVFVIIADEAPSSQEEACLSFACVT